MKKNDFSVHLISMPWFYPIIPSIQLGSLRAYIEQNTKADIQWHEHNAHLRIPYRYRGYQALKVHQEWYRFGEYIYWMLSNRQFGCAKGSKFQEDSEKTLLEKINFASSRLPPEIRITLGTENIESFQRANNEYLDEEVIPKVNSSKLNLIGMTMVFDQVHSSIYAAKYIASKVKKPVFFLFGGFSSTLPNVLDILRKQGLNGFSIFGEGEKRLHNIIEIAQRTNYDLDAMVEEGIKIPGVVSIRGGAQKFSVSKEMFEYQLEKIDDLPIPNYDQYFSDFNKIREKDFHFRFTTKPLVTIEGTRGCFAKCDFCNLNLQWKDFRRSSTEIIKKKAITMARKYGAADITFADNVCDTWSLDFIKSFVQEKPEFSFMMQLRVHHPQDFWTWLSLGNVKVITLGIEALSKPLLDKISKRTSPVINLLALKYLKELGIQSSSGLITHHPKSTMEDVIETERALKQIPHLEPLGSFMFHLGYGSPVYNSLSKEEQSQLKPRHYFILSDELSVEIASTGYFCPPSLGLPKNVVEGWDKVYSSLVEWFHSSRSQRPVFSRKRLRDGRVRVTDSRSGKKKQYTLEGARAKLFESCHQGRMIDAIEDKKSLQWLLDNNLLFRSADHIVNLALRPRAELIEALLQENQRRLIPEQTIHSQSMNL